MRFELQLEIACQQGDIEGVRFLLSRYPDVFPDLSKTLWKDYLHLHLAIQNKHWNIFELLCRQLSANGKLDEIDSSKQILLHSMIHANCVEAVKILLTLNVDYKKLTDKGKGGTSMAIAAHEGHIEIIRLLAQHDPSTLLLQCVRGSVPIQYASCHGLPSTIQLMFDLIVKYYDIDVARKNLDSPNEIFFTAMHQAAACDETENLKQLYKLGAKIDPLSTNGNTPIYIALFNNHMSSVELLLRMGSQSVGTGALIKLIRRDKSAVSIEMVKAISNRDPEIFTTEKLGLLSETEHKLAVAPISDRRAYEIRQTIYFEPSLTWRLMLCL